MSQLLATFFAAVALSFALIFIGARAIKPLRYAPSAVMLSVVLHAVVTWTAKQLIGPDGIVLVLTFVLGAIIYFAVLGARWPFAIGASVVAIVGQVVAMFYASGLLAWLLLPPN